MPSARKRPHKKTASKKATTIAYLVCEKCGSHNSLGAAQCSCGGKRFAPEWVRELRRVNRSLSVQVTRAHPNSARDDDVISLYKWWPGGRTSFNILTPAQWEAIKKIIDTELGPLLSWTPSSTASRAMKQTVSDADLAELARQHPDRFAKLVKALEVHIDLPAAESDDLLVALADLVNRFDRASISRVTRIVSALSEEGAATVEQLDEAISGWSVSQVAAVVRETRRRLAAIDLLRASLKDEQTFEIRGDNSIHSILERDLWLLDESYWLIQSNKTLKTFIGDKMAEVDKARYGKKRPDFAAGTLGDRLIIVELKRPSHNLSKDDLNQLEEYLSLAEKYSDKFKSQKGYLLGSEITDEVRRHLKYRRGMDVLSYWEVLEATEKRYKAFLKYREKDWPGQS